MKRTPSPPPAPPPTPPPEKPPPKPESIFSLTFHGALPEILRAMASELENGSAAADNFTSVVGRDTYELRAVIHLRGNL